MQVSPIQCFELVAGLHFVPASRSATQDSAPPSFNELVTLSSTAKPDVILAARLDSLLTTPFIHNEESAANAEPLRPTVANVDPVLRIGLWNIERGLNFEMILSALTDTNDFERFAGDQSHIKGARKE